MREEIKTKFLYYCTQEKAVAISNEVKSRMGKEPFDCKIIRWLPGQIVPGMPFPCVLCLYDDNEQYFEWLDQDCIEFVRDFDEEV